MNAWIKTTLGMAIVWATTFGAARAEEEHPRILASQPLLEAIRTEVGKKGSHHQQVYEVMKARVEQSYQDLAKAYYPDRAIAQLKADDYVYGYRARETAFLAMLAMTPKEQKKYGELAYKAALELALPGGPKASSLAGAQGAQSIGLAYDWSYQAWTAEQRAAVRARAAKHLDAMVGGRGEREIGFNKGGVINGAMLVLIVALCEEDKRKAAYTERRDFLKRHIEQCYDAWGISQEGLGYSEYPLAFALPAVYAARRIGDDELTKTAATRSWWKLLMYASTFADGSRRSAMWGVSTARSPGEGMASLAFGTVPADQVPYYLWWYNRCEGMKSTAPGLLKFDSHRGCLPYAMLCYPVGVEEKDPTGALPPSYYSQTRGFAFFRNRWKDADDILLTISADAHNAGIGWDSCGTLGLNLLAFNTRFFGQPEKGGNVQAYSTLLVDGRNSVGSAAAALGKPDTYEPAKDGGYAIVDGGAVYQGLGCKSAKRHLLARFASDKSQAVLATLDRLESMTPHLYTWQANLGRQADDDGIVVSGGQEGGRPMFLLKGRNEGFVKGWIVHPAAAAVEAKGDPLRIHVKGDNVDLWVVMLAGQGAPPAATVTGSGLESVVTVAGNKVRFDAKAARMTAE